MSSYPPRLGHLVTRAVAAAKLRPMFANSHEIDEDEAQERLERALSGPLWEALLDAAWTALNDKKRADPEALLEKIAGTLKDRPLRPGRQGKELNPAMSAFLVLIDLEAGTASDAARKLLESAQGEQMKKMGLLEAGRFLAQELTR